jgi:uncharacterized protein YqhQ
MMLTPLAAAIAREGADGSLFIESFELPERKPHPIEKLPFIRILPKLIGQMSLVVRGWKPKKARGLPLPLLAAIVGVGILSSLINGICAGMPSVWHAAGSSLLQLALFFGLVGLTRAVPRFGRIWRFHGGEHQAIAAYEAGLDLTVENTSSRTLYHPRCGTNLATLSLLIMVPGMVLGSVISGFTGYLITVAIPLPALCIAFELMMWGQKRVPGILWPGLAFQRLTVALPGPAESLAGIAALKAALAEHARVESARAPTQVGVGAAR